MAAHMISSCKFSLFATLAVLSFGACNGPDDTTIALTVNALTSPTNENSVVVSGSTDADSEVRVEATGDTVIGSAGGQGAFSFTLQLALNQLNTIDVQATDPAGNSTSETLTVLHDNIAPILSFTSPPTNVGSQSGFTVAVSLADEASGIDANSLSISNSEDIGGAFKTDGSSTTAITAGDELISLFDVSGGQAAFVVPDTFFFSAGINQLSASVSDNAGNNANASHSVTVQPDDSRLIIVDASGNPGDNDVPLTVGLANGIIISGLQFDIVFDTLIVDSIANPTPVDRAGSFSDSPSNETEPGRLRVLLFDGGGDIIDQGQGAVIQLTLFLSPTAPLGEASLGFQGIVASEPGGSTTGLADASGVLTVQ